MKKYGRDLEFKSKAYIEKTQVAYLKELVKYLAVYSPFYKKKPGNADKLLRQINSIKDVRNLPITTKTHIQKNNSKFFCVNNKDLVEVVSTTGTTGNPVYIALAKQDLNRLALNEMRSFECANATAKDTFHIAVTLDNLFMAGMAYYLGITKLGATVYRAGLRNVKKQIQLIQELKPTGIVTVPSFFLVLADAMIDEGIDINKTSIKKALLVGESLRDQNLRLNSIGSLMSEKWPVDLYSTYGNSECGISFCECEHKKGSHEHPDLIISEILDDEGNPVPEGGTGELVLTTLQVKGMPLLRYQTGDITFKMTEKCKCGRSSSRIGPILGRKAQMMKFKGVKVYPKTIENAILNIKGVHNHIVEAYTGDDYSDRIVVKIGCEKKNKRIEKEVLKNVEAHARVRPEVKVLSIEEVDFLRTEGGTRRKVRLFIDNRKMSGESPGGGIR